MSTLKSYSEARRELEKIASKRKQFFSNSKILREELEQAKQAGSSPSPYASPAAGREALFGSVTSVAAVTSPFRSSGYGVGVGSGGSSSSSRDLRPLMSSPSPSVPSKTPYKGGGNSNSSSSSSNHALLHDFGSTGGSSIFRGPLNASGVDVDAFASSSAPFDTASSVLSGPASSVIAAFRQLQAKARQVEQERADALRDRDELRRQHEANLRTQAFWRSQSEMQANDSYQTMRAATEQIAAARRDLELQLITAQDVSLSLQRANAGDRAVVTTLESEITDVRDKLQVARAALRTYELELSTTQSRCDRVTDTVQASPPARSKQKRRVEEAVHACEEQVDATERATAQAQMRVDALQRYTEVILGINGDLCRRIMETTTTKEHIRELAERLAPPRYAWPKGAPLKSVIGAIGGAAAEKATRDSAARVAAAADAVVRGSSPAAAVAHVRGAMADVGRVSWGGGAHEALVWPEAAGDRFTDPRQGADPFGFAPHRSLSSSMSSSSAAAAAGLVGGGFPRNAAVDPVLSSMHASTDAAAHAAQAAIHASVARDKFDLDAAYRKLAADTIRQSRGRNAVAAGRGRAQSAPRSRTPAALGRGFIPGGNTKHSFNVAGKRYY